MIRPTFKFTLIAFYFCLMVGEAHAASLWNRPSHHQLTITLDPVTRSAEIQDTLTLYPNTKKKTSLTFLLHDSYLIDEIEISHKGNWKVATQRDQNLKRITIFKPDGQVWPEFLEIRFRYHGPYFDPLRSGNADNAKDSAVFLSRASYFYPVAESEDGLLTFSLAVNTPPDWKVVSQGKRIRETTINGPRHTFWQCDDPMEEIFLVADRFHEYTAQHEDVRLYVFLRSEDADLADRYLNSARAYISFYEKLLGAYPFVKFAMVENSLQTGYGMPSFTLLGSRLIRFPFILTTSYPHEILHNWWGNSVYIDPASGNWSEGLTTYLSDHLLQELEGKGDRYRFQQLMQYLNYVNAENDFPLEKFQARTDRASQAIGYGKMVMVLQMLRLEMGDQAFLHALGDFYFTQRFRRAGFRELRAHFESAAGKNMEPFFRQWTKLKGAPQLELADAVYEEFAGEYRVSLDIRQKQQRPLFQLTLPVAVWVEGKNEPHIENLALEQKEQQTLRLFVAEKPRAVLLDPYYDVFRKLDRREVPASIGQTYGAKSAQAVLPTDDDMKSGYEKFAQALGAEVVVRNANDGASPTAGALWIFGRNNPMAAAMRNTLEKYGVVFGAEEIRIDGKTFPWQDHSFVFTVPHPDHPNHSATWLIADSTESLPGLQRKLPHYGKYGALVFKGTAPDNQFKSTWPAQRTGLLKTFTPGDTFLPSRPPLVNFKPEF